MAQWQEFDYIIVGAGSAGCVLADKLSADGSNRILIVEAGSVDTDLFMQIPAGFYNVFMNPKFNWNYETVEEASIFGRKIYQPRGKVLGGSSSINAMVYMRGHPRDYDRWSSELGLTEWDYSKCLPYFRAGETSDRGADMWRGGDGPLHVTKGRTPNPLYDALLEAGVQSGQGVSEDLNGYKPEGVARFDRTTTRGGRRCSAAVAYLRPALKRGNVSLVTSALVQKVVLRGTRAVGIEYKAGGALHTAHAAKEVILSGGSINSPQVLMLSGIGPADHLRSVGLDVHHELRGVGQNLHDHPTVGLKYECLKPVTPHFLNGMAGKALVGLQWLLSGTGLGASNLYEGGGLIKSSDGVEYPDIEYHFMPVGVSFTDAGGIKLDQGFHLHQDLLRPTSRGELKLRSANPEDKPLLQFNYLQTEEDRRNFVNGILKGRELIAQRAFDEFRGKEIYPGKEKRSFDEIDHFARSTMETDYHPCSTCRMGTDEMSVVDQQLRVNGIDGLRVVDASILPRVTSGNTNAPTQMIAARAADFILGRNQRQPVKARFHFSDGATP